MVFLIVFLDLNLGMFVCFVDHHGLNLLSYNVLRHWIHRTKIKETNKTKPTTHHRKLKQDDQYRPQ
jgi:hypothetical protein